MVANPVLLSGVVFIFHNNSSINSAVIGGCKDRKVKKGDIEPGSPGRDHHCFPYPHQNNPKNKKTLVSPEAHPFICRGDPQTLWQTWFSKRESPIC